MGLKPSLSKISSFEGVGVDGAYLPFHKANQFPGDGAAADLYRQRAVDEMPDVPRYIAEYRKHLAEIFA